MGSHEYFWYRRSLNVIQVLRDFHEHTFVYEEIFCLPTTAGNTHDALTGFPLTYQRSDSVNITCELQAWNIGRHSGWRGIVTGTLRQIGSVESGCAYSHSHQVCHWLGFLNFPNF
jgi:hypothetical protein